MMITVDRQTLVIIGSHSLFPVRWIFDRHLNLSQLDSPFHPLACQRSIRCTKQQKDKKIALYNMKCKMMEKAQLYNGKDESIHQPDTKPTSQAIAALAHQTGIDYKLIQLLVNKRDIDPITRVSSEYSILGSGTKNRNGLESATHSSRIL